MSCFAQTNIHVNNIQADGTLKVNGASTLAGVTATTIAATTVAASGTVTGSNIPASISGAGPCVNQFVRVLNAGAAPTCAAVNLAADITGLLPLVSLTSPTGTGFVHTTAGAIDGASKMVSLTADTAANQGTTTTLLHGNAAGQPSFGSVTGSDLNITSTICTNQFVRTIGVNALGTCATVGTNDLAASLGLVTPNIGAAAGTSLNITGQYTSTVATGTPPLVVSSTTNVPNLNASTLSGKTHADPGPIGSGTPSTGAFTALTATGNVTATAGQNILKAYSFDTVLYVDGNKYTTIQSCLNDLPSSAWPAGGGTCIVPPYYTETLAANLTITKSGTTIQFNGPASITQDTFQVTMASGVKNVSIVSNMLHGQTGAVSTGVVFQSYSGSAAAFSIGDSSGVVESFLLRNIAISIDAAAANAVGLLLTNVQKSFIDHPWCTIGPVAGQVCYKTNGTGAFFAGIIDFAGAECNSSGSATTNKCIMGGAISNNVNIYGGHANMGGGANSSVCIDVNGATSSGWYLAGFDCDVAQTAVTVEATTVAAIYSGWLRQDAGVVNTANFAAGSQGNMIITNVNLPFTDSGVAGTNSVIYTNRYNWRTDKWQLQQQATFMQWIDVTDSSPRMVFVNGATGRSDFNGGSGAGTTNLAWDSGTGGVLFGNGAGAQAGSAAVDSSGNATFTKVTSTIATGTAPLVIASTTNVPNLNASSLSGATFASPGAIGGTAPAAGTFTALTLPEAAAASGVSAKQVIFGDSGDHMLKFNPNNGGEQHVPQIYMLTAQYTNSTTTFSTVGTPNIAFPVNASKNYTAECHLYYQAAATGGLNIEFTGPASPTAVIYGMSEPVALGTTDNSVATAFSTSLGNTIITGTTNFDATVSFSLINGVNAGTVTLLAKSSAAAQLQIQAGSFCRVQ